MYPMVSTCETTMPNMHIGSTELGGRDPAGVELPASTMNSGLTGSSFSMLMSHEMLTPYKQKAEFEPVSNHLNLRQYSVPNSESEQPQFLYAGLGEETLSCLNKRKAAELRPLNPSLTNHSSFNKRAALSGSSPRHPGVVHLTSQNKRTEAQSRSPRTSVSSKRTVQIDPLVSKSQSAGFRCRSMQSEKSSGIEAEKLDPVRAKLRESLTAALALVSEQKASSFDADKTKEMAAAPNQKGDSESATYVSSTAISKDPESAGEGYGSISICPTNNSDAKSDSQELHLKDVSGEPWKFLGQDFQSNPVFPNEDAPFGESLFLRDELLQGNGLSWALDFDAQIAEMQAVGSTQRDELAHEADEQEKKQADLTPESVASEIEAELFTLFGGVNKKYKEKGRSLLFNLKDRNNPELRERVMSGEISPDRLCTMTAEELASKELSQWRMAKAEELDQMKVLPDSEVDVRRLVKKTHKGEYQVEFDQDISVVEDVPVNVSVIRENARRKTSGGVGHHSKGVAAKEHGNGDCTITIPGDGTDMQGLMVDDMRDLPPILSLDEFMDSLDKEPPFESLPEDSVRTPELDNSITKDTAESNSPVLPSEETTEKNEAVNEESVQRGGQVHSAENQTASGATLMAEQIKKPSDVNIMAEQIKLEYLWEGLLQLTLSSAANVVAIYKSGEKTSAREWPKSFEIKGRVRLDAFDKFLQELPKSRTRATMVVHFALAIQSTDEERCSLIDLIDSYVTDQRLGYAEPAPGLELYVCPPRSRTVDMIVKHLPKGYTEKLSDIDNGLIGVLVWRKEHIPSAPLPNPSSQHKYTTSEHHSTFSRQLPEKDTRRDVSFASRAAPPPPTVSKPASITIDDDDDVPPGFGPSGGPREDDDLPEFNFSAGSNLSRFPTPKLHHQPPVSSLRPDVPSRQVEQMRALIQKYGKSGDNTTDGIPIQPWNADDDDDDIPEWQPQTVIHQQPHMPPGFPAPTFHVAGHPSFQQPVVPVANTIPSVQPSIATQGAWRHPVTLQPAGGPRIRGGQPPDAQFYSAPVTGHQNRDRRSSNAFNRIRGP